MCGIKSRFLVLIQAILVLGLLVHCEQRTVKENEPQNNDRANKPPLIKFAEIQPSAPTVQADLGVALGSSDADGDPVTHRFQWMVNDEKITGATGDTLPMDMFEKGDEVQCMIVPTDGKTEGRRFVTRSVKVANSLPVIERMEIKPQVLFRGAEVEVAVEVRDPDQDPVSLSYEWFVNDRPAQNNGPRFPLTNCSKRDRISVRVRASDGEGQGAWTESRVVMVQNRPPTIVSKPPSGWREGEGFEYRVRAVDPDGDQVRVWVQGELPPGMLWSEDDHTLTWKSQDDAGGSYEIEVVAEDEDGGVCKQGIVLTVGG